MKNKIFAILLSLSVIFTSLSVYAADLNNLFVTEDFWNNNSTVSTTKFYIENANISGVCRYIFDSSTNEIYFRFDFAGKINNSKLKINFNFEDGEVNNFSINQNGMCDYNGNENTKYNVIYNFDTVPMIGIKIPSDSYINYLSVNFYYQGRNQIVLSNLLLDATPVTSIQATKAVVNKQTTTKAPTEKQTKYIPQVTKYVPNNNQNIIISSIEEQTSTSQYYYSKDAVNSSNKRIFTATLGAVALVISIVFLIIYFARKRNPLDD